MFAALLQDLFGDLEANLGKISKRRKGNPIRIDLGAAHGRALTDLRFADDVLLVAQSKADIKKMIGHVIDGSRAYGLSLNFSKTKVLTWNHLWQACGEVLFDEGAVEVLGQNTAEKYLGRKLAQHAQRGTREQDRSCVGSLSHPQARALLQALSFEGSLPTIRRHRHANFALRMRSLGLNTPNGSCLENPTPENAAIFVWLAPAFGSDLGGL